MLLEAKGNAIASQVYGGPSDWVDVTRLPAPIPWTLFTDRQQTISRSMQGQPAAAYLTLPVFGNMNVLYNATPALVDGKLERLYPELFVDPILGILPHLRRFKLREGPRGTAIMNPYCTWHGHTRRLEDGSLSLSPHVPWWVGVLMDGTMAYAMRDGSVRYPFRLPLATYCNDFTFYEPREAKLFFAVDTGAGRILKVDRRTDPPSTTVFATGFGTATSIRAIGQKLYVANNKGGAIWEVDVPTGHSRKVCDLPHVFWLDSTSTGKLVAALLTNACHVVEPGTGAIGPNLVPNAAQTRITEWVQCSVDRQGTFGPIDAFTSLAVTGVRNVTFRRMDLSGRTIGMGSLSQGRMSAGPVRYVVDVTGHYPWVAEHHPDEGCLMVQGLANLNPSIIAAVHPDDGRPATHPYNYQLNMLGETLMQTGGRAVGGGRAPSFSALMTTSCWSLLGCTADYIAEMPFAEAKAFVRKGMIGSVLREFSANEMRALLYYLYYNSQRHLREGAPLIAALLASDMS